MADSTRKCTVRIDRRLFERLALLAAEQDCTPSDVIRAAVEGYLGTAALLSASHRRLARICEFMQLALDVIISEQHPEFRDRIIAGADKRLEQYHGG